MDYMLFGQYDFANIQLDMGCNCHDLELMCSVLQDSQYKRWILKLVSAALQDTQCRMLLLHQCCNYRVDKGHNKIYQGCFGKTPMCIYSTNHSLDLVCKVRQDSQCKNYILPCCSMVNAFPQGILCNNYHPSMFHTNILKFRNMESFQFWE